MATDDIKLAWQELDRRMERQEALLLRQLRDERLTRARHSLWPLVFGQVVQILVGIVVIVLGVAAWQPHSDVPHVLIAGIVVHAYGVIVTMLAGIMLGRMFRIDYAAPVVVIQRQLASLRLFYIRCGMAVGLPWWVLWVPFAMVSFAVLLGVDLYARIPLAANLGILLGFVGLLGTWLFRRWAHHPARGGLGERLDDAAAGGSLRKARRIVDEMKSFERDE
ncbi:hypothetical protein [Paraliomyxa miuraensis]|uniref:hypothetical protein n=1 Tax=Paraliomyxa miuraensis TaxID=376150 RepID=UPI00225BFB99|nr:hypothetical protein [Paraliomyxa miuraensis]MCX4247953.1 hypothetical protein [Paraliomyxa miuraensis]